MLYTIGEMARLLDIPASTLRYYDKEGLLPFVARSNGGIRMFQDSGFEWLQVIGCLKSAGMSIRDIREYIRLALAGDSTVEQRLALFQRQREALLAQMAALQETPDTLDYKCWFYETARSAGTVEAPQNLRDGELPPKFRAVRRRLKKLPERKQGA